MDLTQLREQFHHFGVEDHDVYDLGSTYPGLVAQLTLPRGRYDRPPADYFDLFIPTRSVKLRELSGGYDRGTYLYRTGVVGFTPAGASWIAEWRGAVQGIGFTFSEEVVSAVALEEFGGEAGTLEWRLALADHAPTIAHLGLDIASQIISGRPMGDRHVDRLLHTFLSLVGRRYSSTPERDSMNVDVRSRQVLKALSYIDANLSETIDLMEICDKCGASPSHMNRLFRAELGVSVWDYVLTQRLKRVASQLREGERPINALAQDAGFASASHLSRAFKAAFNLSPTAYRSTSADAAADALKNFQRTVPHQG